MDVLLKHKKLEPVLDLCFKLTADSKDVSVWRCLCKLFEVTAELM